MSFLVKRRRPHFIGYLSGEAPFYWVNSGVSWRTLFIYVQNYAGGWLEFHFMVHALPGGLVILIKLFYWCGLRPLNPGISMSSPGHSQHYKFTL